MIKIDDFKRLSELGEKIKNTQASKAEKDEYMSLMYNKHLITEKQYDDYKKSSSINNSDELIKAALIVGAIALLIYLLSESN